MADDHQLLLQIHQDVLVNSDLLGKLKQIQRGKYANAKGLYLLYVQENSGIKFVKKEEINAYFSQPEIQQMVTKRIDFSNPKKDFVLGTVIPGAGSYFNNYRWDLSKPVIVPGL